METRQSVDGKCARAGNSEEARIGGWIVVAMTVLSRTRESGYIISPAVLSIPKIALPVCSHH